MDATFLNLDRRGPSVLPAERPVDLALEVADGAYVLRVGRSVPFGGASELSNNRGVQRMYLGV